MTLPTDNELVHDAVSSLEDELLQDAFADEPPARDADDQGNDAGDAGNDAGDEGNDAAAGEQPDGQPRNARGQFARREEQQADAQEGEGEGQTEDDQQAGNGENDVPRWRLREIAEERRQAIAERDALRTELARVQAQRVHQPQPQAQPQQEIDPLLDPQGFAQRIQQGFEQRLAEIQLNNSLGMAHVRHGEKFERAYEALLGEGQRGNHQLVRQLTSQANPGEAIVRWHRNAELMREVGDKGLDGYAEKLLANPEFLKKAAAAIAKANGQQQGQQGQGSGNPRNITRIPPSLSRQAGSNASSRGEQLTEADGTDAAVFDYAMR